MTVIIQPDLLLFCAEMIECNGFDINEYINGLLEKGIRADLNETYTEDSVREYMNMLGTRRVSQFSLLQPIERK